MIMYNKGIPSLQSIWHADQKSMQRALVRALLGLLSTLLRFGPRTQSSFYTWRILLKQNVLIV